MLVHQPPNSWKTLQTGPGFSTKPTFKGVDFTWPRWHHQTSSNKYIDAVVCIMDPNGRFTHYPPLSTCTPHVAPLGRLHFGRWLRCGLCSRDCGVRIIVGVRLHHLDAPQIWVGNLQRTPANSCIHLLNIEYIYNQTYSDFFTCICIPYQIQWQPMYLRFIYI